jgi:hypothetical protein
VRQRARRLIHRLGERGLFEYQQLLDAEHPESNMLGAGSN